MSDITIVLSEIESGDPAAADKLLPLVYDHLRKLAAARLALERPGQTLQSTALVHEAYLRVTNGSGRDHWNSRGHLFAAAAEAMRRILVENARRKNALKAGGDLVRIEMPVNELAAPSPENLITLSDTLDKLAVTDWRKAELVKLRFFAGLTLSKAAHVLGISDATADADWAYAKAWLRVEMDGECRK